MLRLLFDAVRPDVVTIETIRFLDYDAMEREFDLSVLDAEFVAAVREARGLPYAQGCEVPDEFRKEVYQFIFDELDAVGCEAPVAFCREKRTLWEHFAETFARWGQHPDDYVCNCGPRSAPRLAEAEIATDKYR